MKLVVFGLSVSSSWGNGHATLWRGLIGALAEQGHRVVFFERDAPWYAQHRDIAPEVPGLDLVIYRDWREALPLARAHLADADVGMVTSYCHDGVAATHEVLASRARRAFYDLDAPVTLERVRAGVRVPWLGADGLRGFDIVLSYAGGATLDGLRRLLGARRAAPLYGSVDPAVHAPAPPREHLRADLSYLGTYAADRQAALDALLLACARRRPEQRFLIGGSQYPPDFPWGPNVHYGRHVPPADHGAFYSSSRLTLSVTRGPMAAVGWCPSGRLFEAAACGAAVLTDAWPGLEVFFRPGEEVLVARTTDEALAALDTPAHVLRRIGCAARERALRDHTAAARARELVDLLGAARDGRRGEAA